MKPRFRFTLDGEKTISDPIGWKDMVNHLDRDLEYHSLVEVIDLPLEFYGRVAGKDGGYQYLKDARANGIDTQVIFLAEISFNDSPFEYFFQGVIDLTTMLEIERKKRFQVTLSPDSLWAKFINRKAIPVDIQSPTSIDGDAISVVTPKTQSLLNQELQITYSGSRVGSLSFALATGSNPYAIIDFNAVTLDEITTKRNYSPQISPTRPFELFAIDLDGEYAISAEINLSTGGPPTAAVDAGVNVYIQINDAAPIAFARVNAGGPNVRTVFTYSATHSLVIGDFVRLYVFTTFTQTVTWETGFDNFLLIEADTTFIDSSCPAFAIHDVGLSVVNRIVSRNDSLYSEFFGGTDETAISYSGDGDGLHHALLLGQHLRGYTLTDKPFSISFDEWWEGANNIFNLGLGYDNTPVGAAIRVEKKEHFYDDSAVSATLEDVEIDEISFDPDFINTSVEIGYQEWAAESASGIDDPQTKHTYATRFKTVGTEEKKNAKILSTFYAASLGIEQTRRLRLDAGTDWKLDEKVIILESELTTTTGSPKLYTSPTYEIANLLNSDTRYNVRLTPASNLYRWKNFLNIGFNGHFFYSSDFYKFSKGEGNTTMTFNFPGGGGVVPPDYVQENGDVLIDTGVLFKNIIYKFKHNLTWDQYKQIRGDRERAIRVRYYGNDGLHYEVIGFIKKLAYKASKSTADWEVWPKTITVI